MNNPELEGQVAGFSDAGPAKISANKVSVFYGEKKAIDEVSIDIHTKYVTAFIGP